MVIVRTEGDQTLVARIRQELESGAFKLTEHAAPDAGTSDLAAIARANGAEAALRVQQQPTEVELWTARPLGDPDGTLDVIREPGTSRHEQEVLVLRVVENLRALGLASAAPQPVSPTEKPPAAPTPGPEPAQEPPKEPAVTSAPAEPEPAAASSVIDEPSRAPQLWLELAPALALSPGGLGPQLQAQLGVRYQPFAPISVSGFALAPLYRSALERAEGTAEASTWILGLAADAHYRMQAFELSAGLGIASVITVMSGDAATDLDGQGETELTAAPLARAGFSLPLGASLRLCLRALIGASVPEVSMRFVEREVASWGQPFVIITLGLELPLIAHAASQ